MSLYLKQLLVRVVSLWNGLDKDLKFKSEVLLKGENHRDFKQKLRQVL